MTPNNDQYHVYGLIAELLDVAHFRIEHMPAASIALNYLIEARKSYESSNPPSEENQEAVTEAVSDTNGPQDSSDVSETR